MTDRPFARTHDIVKHAPLNAEARPEALADEVTSADRFFIRSNFDRPDLDPETHRIVVGGAVRAPYELSIAELHRLPRRTVTVTTECAGNGRTGLVPVPEGEPWRDRAVSTARWTGVPLRTVLERAEVYPDTLEILARGADRGTKAGAGEIPFARSLPLEKALHPDTLLALEMNGAPLPPEHGAPVRLVVPGWYGMASVKWVARIEALTEPFAGYFQRDRYVFDPADGREPTPVSTMRVRAMILDPADGAAVPMGRMTVRGRAWSGDGEVTRVEVAAGGGDDWRDARLLEPSSAYAWRAWEYDWEPAEPGRHVLRCRATDAAGNVQPDRAGWNRHGYGNNAIQPIFVEAR